MRDKLIISPWLALAPALILITVLLGASLVYGIAQSLGLMSVIGQDALNLDAYRNLFTGASLAGREFWGSLFFSIWVSGVSTLLSAIFALLVAFWLSERRNGSSAENLALNWNLAFPHLVWSVALLLFLSQSGLLARWAATLGLIQTPAEFPVLLRDRHGIGIILHYVSKEIPFLTLIVLAVLRGQPAGYDRVAENLGANRWQRLRYVTLPAVAPALLSGSLLVFAFIFSSYEVPALLGVGHPRMLPVLALRLFTDPDLRARADGMAVSLVITAIVLVVAAISLKRGEQR
ncbi:MAG: ABC transporter permease subunit [Anaerolineales bacterium]|nr:ABC transporter permease subunit [Anaerolineales bacterium]